MSKYAVVRSGNKQYKVQLGEVVELEKITAPSKTITFEEVLLFADGEQIKVGDPTVKGVKVVAEVIEAAKKGDKVKVFRFKAKARYRKNKGHRQTHTVVKIVELGGEKLAAPKPAKPAST